MSKIRAVHLDNQIRIAQLAAYTLHYQGKITDGLNQMAKEMAISEARLRAMVKFVQTKGQPTQFTRFFD